MNNFITVMFFLCQQEKMATDRKSNPKLAASAPLFIGRVLADYRFCMELHDWVLTAEFDMLKLTGET